MQAQGKGVELVVSKNGMKCGNSNGIVARHSNLSVVEAVKVMEETLVS